MTAWQRTLGVAQKFAIDRDLAEVIDAMPRRDVQAAMPFCRLPFPVCWIEVAHMDRPHFAAVEVASDHYQPVRVGILCEQDGDDPRKFGATLAWSYTEADARRQMHDDGFIPPPLNVCPIGQYIDTTTPQDWPAYREFAPLHTAFSVKPQAAPYFRDVLAHSSREGLEQVARNADNDWQGEIWFWLGALALVNAKNGVESDYQPAPERLNRARLKAGKRELVGYHQLTLRVGSHRRYERGEGHGAGHMRAHTVRGHFKVRKTGIYWWNPFMRGDVSEGFAGKRYKVKL